MNEVFAMRDPDGASALGVELENWEQKIALPAGAPWVAHGASLPAAPGALTWLDLCTEQGKETSAATFWSELFSWELGHTIDFPGGQYITLLDGNGVANRNKLSGVLPRKAWPVGAAGDVSSCWVPPYN